MVLNIFLSLFLETGHVHGVGGEGVEGEGEGESRTDSMLHVEPNKGLDLITLRS